MKFYCCFFALLMLASLFGCRGTDEDFSLESKAETYFTLDSTTVGVRTIGLGGALGNYLGTGRLDMDDRTERDRQQAESPDRGEG